MLKISIFILIFIVWIALGILGFCLYAKINNYKEASPHIIDDLIMCTILGVFGFMIGIAELIEKKQILMKITQILLNIINHKAHK